MRSKWLSWRPGDETIEDSPDPELTKPTKINSVGFVSSTPAASPIIRDFDCARSGVGNEPSRTSADRLLNETPGPEPTRFAEVNFWGTHRDDYGWRAHAVCERISSQDYPVGTIRWLETAAPYLYDRLTRVLPDMISRAWNAKVPFYEFDRLCSELEETHARGVALFRSVRRADYPGRVPD